MFRVEHFLDIHNHQRKIGGVVEIDLKKIEDNLRAELTPLPTEEYPNPKCPIKFSVKGHTGYQLAVRETDDNISFKINTKRIKTQEQLDTVMADCRGVLSG